MTNLIILSGTSETVPDDLLARYVRCARAGGRLLVVDQGGLASRCADQLTDLMIDPERGNWNAYADLRDVSPHGDRDRQRTIVAEAMLSGAPAPARALAVSVLSEILDRVTDSPTFELGQLKDAIRRFTAGNGRSWLLNIAAAWGPAHIIPSVALLAELGARLPRREPQIPLTSLRRWYAASAGRVLFLRDAGPASDAAPVVRGVLALARALAAGEHISIGFGATKTEAVA